MKLQYAFNGTATQSGFLVPTAHRVMGGVRPEQVRRRLVGGSTGDATASTDAPTDAPGLPSSAPPIT